MRSKPLGLKRTVTTIVLRTAFGMETCATCPHAVVRVVAAVLRGSSREAEPGEHTSLASPEFAEGDLQRDLVAVLMQAGQGDALPIHVADAGLDVAAETVIVQVTEVLGHDQRKRFADDLAGPVTEHAFDGGVGVEFGPVAVTATPTNHRRRLESKHSGPGAATASIDSANLAELLRLDVAKTDGYRIGLIRGRSPSTTELSASVLTSQESVLVLPFTWNELLASVRSEVKEAQSDSNNGLVRFGIATADFDRMEAFRSNQPVALTRTQFKVLRYFVLNPGRVISRNEFLNQVWGYSNYPTTRTVDNTVVRLRKALEPVPAEPVHFRTVHGVGYKFIP